MRKFIINVNGNRYEVEVEEVTNDANTSQTSAPTLQPAMQPERISEPRTASKPVGEKKEVEVSEGANTIKAPMPGTILNINIKEGDRVKSGEILFILEAMKMENEILAPRDGKVISIVTTKNASVNTGDKLAIIE